MNKLIEPNKNCSKCRRLYNFRKKNQSNNPDWFNAPVPTFGELSSSLLIVGLAPGLQGANKTGRPFTGDYAGDLLYKTINKFHLLQLGLHFVSAHIRFRNNNLLYTESL